MRDAEERRKKAQTKMNRGVNSYPFQTNFAHEITALNGIKAKFKLISNLVIQDLYNVLQDADLIEIMLEMTFPNLYNVKAVNQVE